MHDIKEHLIESAIAEVRQGKTQTAAAADWGITQPLLSRRLGGATNHKNSKKSSQRLSDVQENYLVDWMFNEEAAGRAPSRKETRGFAECILQEGGDLAPLGARWIDRFLARHPQVKTKPSSPLEEERARGSTREAYEDFFQRLDTQIKSKGVVPMNISSMGKAGKALDQKNATIAGLKAQVDYLTMELEAHKPHTRKKVRENANDKFNEIAAIIDAQEASQNPPKRRRGGRVTTQPPVSQEVVQQAQEMIFHGLDRIHEQEEG